MSLYIGIDGGGTKTKCVLTDEHLNVIYETQSGPSNFLTIGTEKVTKTIINLIHECCKEGKVILSEINGIVIGTTGAGRESDAKKLNDAVLLSLSNQNISINKFSVVSDAHIALEGAFSGEPGSILIAGTGSIMFGKDKDSLIHRVGGFGRLIGDEGSGLTIGTKGLNIVSKFFDGRGKNSLLTEYLEKEFNITNQSELIIKVYGDGFNIQDIAPLVIKAANLNDELCMKILEEQTDELISHISSMKTKLNEKLMKIVFIGGTITNENAYSKLLKRKIKQILPSIILQQPDFQPEIGAVIMAKNFEKYE